MKSVKFNQQFSFNITKTISKTATVAICFILGGFLASCMSLPTSPAPEQVVPDTEAEQVTPDTAAEQVASDTTVEQTDTQLSTAQDTSTYVAKYLGVLVDPSDPLMTIVDVMYFSPAERAGIEGGDVLVSLDGIPYATESEKIRGLLNQEEPSEEKMHEVIVLREGIAKQFNMHLNIPDVYIPPSETPTAMPQNSNLKLY